MAFNEKLLSCENSQRAVYSGRLSRKLKELRKFSSEKLGKTKNRSLRKFSLSFFSAHFFFSQQILKKIYHEVLVYGNWNRFLTKL